MPKILGITPARGGSKRVPRKNARKICDKPLIAWTIEAAKQSKNLDHYVVSTEDKEIADISRAYGAEVIHRPAELAKDDSTTWDVLRHVIEIKEADIVVLLQCTSPVRDEGLIDMCIERFIKTDTDSLATGFICNFYEWATRNEQCSQDINGYFHDDGNVYVIKADLIRRHKYWGEKLERVIINIQQSYEIDEEFDFWLNEKILKKRLGLID